MYTSLRNNKNRSHEILEISHEILQTLLLSVANSFLVTKQFKFTLKIRFSAKNKRQTERTFLQKKSTKYEKAITNREGRCHRRRKRNRASHQDKNRISRKAGQRTKGYIEKTAKPAFYCVYSVERVRIK